MNQRRQLMLSLGAGALVMPLSVLAQQPGKIWRIGYLTLTVRASSAIFYAAFVRALRELGYVEGVNLVIEARYADGDAKRLPDLAAELVRLKVDLIIANANPATVAAQAATTTIPIVMPFTSDPVGNGIIKSLARPGGNVTGLADLSTELGPKRLEMLLAMTAARSPKVSRVAVLSAVLGNANALKQVQGAGVSVGVTIMPVFAATPEEIDQAFASMRRQKADAMIMLPHPFLVQQRNQIAQLAAQHRLPVSAPFGLFAEAGCLMSYGVDLVDSMRRAATFVDKIFKGAKPADLPVEQPIKFELVINGKTAKALGLTIPQALLISADRVIE